MKKTVKTLMTLIFVLMSFFAQSQTIRVMPVSTHNISNDAATMLYNRLNQAVALNGIGSSDNSNKFLMVTSVGVLSIEPTETVPMRYMAEIEISMFIVDNSRKLVFSQEIITKKGVGDNENDAVKEAMKSIKSRDPKLKKMIVTGKNKILDYYNTECELVVKTINTYLELGMYDEAMNELNAIPQIENNMGCYDSSLNILSKIAEEQKNAANAAIKEQSPDVSWINE